MERLISLFREPDYDQWSPGRPQPPPRAEAQPLYFQQLLEYLREQRETAEDRRRAIGVDVSEVGDGADAEAGTLIGAGA